MKCPLGECFKQDTNFICGQDVVPLLWFPDTTGGQEELDHGHHGHSLGSGEALACMFRER